MRSTLIVLLIVLPPAILAGVMRSQETPKRFAVVEKGHLYRGGFPTAAHIRRMHEDKNVRTVISLTSDEGKEPDREIDGAIKALNMKRYRFPLRGNGTGEIGTLDQAADALAQVTDQPIYFHCAAGHQRSSAVLGAYWMKHKGKSLNQTLKDLSRDYDNDFEDGSEELGGFLREYAQHIGADIETQSQPQPEKN